MPKLQKCIAIAGILGCIKIIFENHLITVKRLIPLAPFVIVPIENTKINNTKFYKSNVTMYAVYLLKNK